MFSNVLGIQKPFFLHHKPHVTFLKLLPSLTKYAVDNLRSTSLGVCLGGSHLQFPLKMKVCAFFARIQILQKGKGRVKQLKPAVWDASVERWPWQFFYATLWIPSLPCGHWILMITLKKSTGAEQVTNTNFIIQNGISTHPDVTSVW